MEIVIIINILASFAAIAYLTRKNSEDKIEIVREVSKALLAQTITDYVETIPEDNEEEEEQVQDELEDVDEVDEKLLIKHLTKKYENNKN